MNILQSMKPYFCLLVLLPALLATGCGTKLATTPIAPTPLPSLTGNWQIQSGPSSPTAAGVVLLGALQSTGSQVTGIVRFSNLSQGLLSGCAVNQVVTVTGTVDASGNLALTSATLPDGTTVTVQLLLPSVLTNFASGTIAVSGKTCGFAATPAIGSEIPSVTGTFSGTLTPGTASTPAIGSAGPVTLALTQTLTPAADGQFPVTGTLAYTFGTCTGSVALSGTVSGIGLTLSYTPPTTHGGLLSTVFLNGGMLKAGTQITAAYLLFTESPCSTSSMPVTATYSGTLTKQ